MRSSNPIFSNKRVQEDVYSVSDLPMTVSGTMSKLLLLSIVMLLGAGAIFYQFSLGHFDFVYSLMTGCAVIGFILALVMFFNVKLTPYLAPIYAFSQGALISGLSCLFEKMFPGIVTQAISITFIVVFTMALAYKARIIQATETFVKVISLATISIGVFYMISFVLMLFGVQIAYFQNLSSPTAIAVNVVIAIVAALNLIIDFDFIEKGVNRKLPSLFEWYGAFGLLVTILWLYVEILRLLARSRNR